MNTGFCELGSKTNKFPSFNFDFSDSEIPTGLPSVEKISAPLILKFYGRFSADSEIIIPNLTCDGWN